MNPFRPFIIIIVIVFLVLERNIVLLDVMSEYCVLQRNRDLSDPVLVVVQPVSFFEALISPNFLSHLFH